VQSGAYSGVPAYKDRDITVGSIHYVITNGRNLMGSYAGQLTPADRWRVAMYIMSAFKAPVAATAPAAATPETNTK
jgi:mono/diheme cytochrome c family protein